MCETSFGPTFDDFVAYYAHQVPELDPAEAIRERHVSFRIIAMAPQADNVQKRLYAWSNRLDDGVLKAVSWCATAWVVSRTITDMRRNPLLDELYTYLMSMWKAGILIWQEQTSMLSVELLDVHAGQAVLDLCAAPGAKTTHLAEKLNGSDNSIQSALLVANESDHERAKILARTLDKTPSPYTVITVCDGRLFPLAESGARLFDRVLCDVPCSCDGMARKPAARQFVTHEWSTEHGVRWHSVQLEILKRASLLVRTGGVLVYSTCSLDPLQNEAIVAAFLGAADDFELVDCGSRLPASISAHNGLVTWDVWNPDTRMWHKTFQEDLYNCSSLSKTLFAPGLTTSEALHLDRCLRFLPDENGSGAAFIAVMRCHRRTSSDDGHIPIPVKSALTSVGIDMRAEVAGSHHHGTLYAPSSPDFLERVYKATGVFLDSNRILQDVVGSAATFVSEAACSFTLAVMGCSCILVLEAGLTFARLRCLCEVGLPAPKLQRLEALGFHMCSIVHDGQLHMFDDRLSAAAVRWLMPECRRTMHMTIDDFCLVVSRIETPLQRLEQTTREQLLKLGFGSCILACAAKPSAAVIALIGTRGDAPQIFVHAPKHQVVELIAWVKLHVDD